MSVLQEADLKGARRVYDGLPIHLGPTRYDASVYQPAEEFPLYLLDCPPPFDRKGLYGEAGADYPDNHIRFAVFARAALAVARVLFRTEIFHCHDWQSGPLPAYLRTTFSTDPTFLGVKTLFTIHNLGYQGLFPGPCCHRSRSIRTSTGPTPWSSSAASARYSVLLTTNLSAR